MEKENMHALVFVLAHFTILFLQMDYQFMLLKKALVLLDQFLSYNKPSDKLIKEEWLDIIKLNKLARNLK